MSNWTPVLYMSRATTFELWQLLYGTVPDTTGDLRLGVSRTEVLFDDRMALGEIRIEKSPETRG